MFVLEAAAEKKQQEKQEEEQEEELADEDSSAQRDYQDDYEKQNEHSNSCRLLTVANPIPMQRVLITGMSGTGKSTALIELGRRGFQVVDTDEPPWSEWSDEDGGYVWREDLIAELLARDDGLTLYVSGTVSNQGRFYSQFDAIVLLSAPADVLLRRVERRTTNDYGKTSEQRELILGHLAEVEHLLRASCTHEIDATQPIADVVEQLVELGRA